MEGYTEQFYRDLHAGSLQSAQVVVPLVMELLSPKRVVDVGCGTGAWLSIFLQKGVTEIVGVDGPGVPTHLLAIPPSSLLTQDLCQPLTLGRFDLAVCLEVAEHLPATAATTLVDSLTGLAPWVLFSAAIPHQGGTGHINERWPDSWADLFESKGYLTVDCFRSKIWRDPRVCWWYAQNLLLFGKQEAVQTHPLVKSLWERTERSRLAIVHPQLFLQMTTAFIQLLKRSGSTPG